MKKKISNSFSATHYLINTDALKEIDQLAKEMFPLGDNKII